MYVLYVCVSEGICVKYISGFFLKSLVSEICEKQIHVNQGVGVHTSRQ